MKLGDYVYGYRNGNTLPGEGYLYRGRGVIQITGKTHYTNFSNYYKNNFDQTVNIKDNPDILVNNLEIAIISGLWFFKTMIIDKITINDQTTVNQVTLKVNPSEQEDIKKLRKNIFKDQVKPHAKCN